ncbi:MAG TPA: hypothetical protein PLK12_12695 [Prolixibacteraceae bacterium]|nr:hypothetical protein [Prolixibacteraceae bacterium]
MKKKIVKALSCCLLFGTLLFVSCSDEDIAPSNYAFLQTETVIYTREQANAQGVPEDIAEYYRHLADIARWYALNPSARSLWYPPTQITYHPFLSKLEHLVLMDTLGQPRTFFALTEKERESFLECWSLTEAAFVASKLRKAPDNRVLERFDERNRIFSRLSENLKSAPTHAFDPCEEISDLLNPVPVMNDEEAESEGETADTVYREEDFWETAIRNYHASCSIIQSAPLQLPAHSFIDRIRPSIRSGRLLIALPGGWTIHSLLVLYPHKELFDVGHVAVFTKDSDELGDSLSGESILTMGSSLKYNTNLEKIGQSWLYKHALAFVGQVCTVEWHARSDGKGALVWDKVMKDADNKSIRNEALRHEGKPYCNVVDVFFSKKAAPESFICSSLAWYSIRETSGIEIGDWLNTSIYPADIFLSENVKIIDDTLE